VQGVFGFIKRHKNFIGGYGKCAFAEGDDFHKNMGCVWMKSALVKTFRCKIRGSHGEDGVNKP
jgi:hypothetical protein